MPTTVALNGQANTDQQTLTLDGDQVTFSPGESLFEVAQRHRREVPSLCYDERLEAWGGCRLCVVELEGVRNPVASCTTKAAAGMVVRTQTPALEAHRKTLVELVVSENPPGDVDPLSGLASGELSALAQRYDVEPGVFAGARSGQSNADDNPFILRDYDRCISCYRCVRVCAEREGDYAISVKGRGFLTQIIAGHDESLADSDCTFCGQCVQTCPTGALADKKALRHVGLKEPEKTTRSICPYCGVGCSVDIVTKGETLVAVRPAKDGPANQGALCVKGQFAFDWVQHPERLKTPLVRNDAGDLVEASWDEALDRAAAGFLRAKEKHGRHSVYAVASGRAPHESSYLVQKWIRTGFGSHYIDNCSRA